MTTHAGTICARQMRRSPDSRDIFRQWHNGQGLPLTAQPSLLFRKRTTNTSGGRGLCIVYRIP